MAIFLGHILTLRFACECSERLLSFYDDNRNETLFGSVAAVGLTDYIVLVCITASHIPAHREVLVVVHHQKNLPAELGSYLAGFRQRNHINRFFVELTETSKAPNRRFIRSRHRNDAGVMECKRRESAATMIAGDDHIVMLIQKLFNFLCRFSKDRELVNNTGVIALVIRHALMRARVQPVPLQCHRVILIPLMVIIRFCWEKSCSDFYRVGNDPPCLQLVKEERSILYAKTIDPEGTAILALHLVHQFIASIESVESYGDWIFAGIPVNELILPVPCHVLIHCFIAAGILFHISCQSRIIISDHVCDSVRLRAAAQKPTDHLDRIGFFLLGLVGQIKEDGPLAPIGNIELVNWKSNTLSQRSKNLTTLSALYTIAETMLKDENYSSKVLPDEEELKAAYQRVANFWSVSLEKIQAFREYLELTHADLPVSRLREESILLKPVTQMALAHVALRAQRKNIRWEDIVERLNQIDWSYTNDLWFNILVIGSANKKMITGKDSIRCAGAVISYLIMGDELTRSETDEVRQIIRNARNDENAKLPSMIN